ncbi:hypothetical protein V6N13_026827 [Hibiscus sabdariffa]
MPPLMAFIPPIRTPLLSSLPPLPLYHKEKKGSMSKEIRVLYWLLIVPSAIKAKISKIMLSKRRLGGGWGRNVPSDGFIFHPILNDRQDQTCCSDPVRALDRVEPYVCCREEGAEPSLNVRHPS